MDVEREDGRPENEEVSEEAAAEAFQEKAQGVEALATIMIALRKAHHAVAHLGTYKNSETVNQERITLEE